MKAIKQAYSDGWRSLVKVDKYSYNEYCLGDKFFAVKNGYAQRIDFSLKNADE
jgi:hypothetical protein